MTDYVVTGLVTHRAELTGEIERTHERLRKLPADLEPLDAPLLMFAPGLQVEAIKPKAFRPPEDWSRRGEMTGIVLSIFRQAAEPLTTRDIAFELPVERALDKNDQKRLRLITKRVGVALGLQRERGVAQCEQGSGSLWLGKSCVKIDTLDPG